MKRSARFIQAYVVFSLMFSACSPLASTATPTTFDVENAVQVLPTSSIANPAVMDEEVPTPQPVIPRFTPEVVPTDVYSIIGTPVAERQQVIDISNIDKLKKVAQWGRGSILGVAFAPNGNHFIAISELGWSIYDINTLDQAPLWAAFSEPVIFDQFFFSTDGMYVKFVIPTYPTKRTVIRRFPSGDLVKLDDEVSWLNPNGTMDYGKVTLNSPDGTKVFRSVLTYEYNEELFTEEKTVREMYDNKNNLLYSLRDQIPYVNYSDRNGPEGCDLSVFSPCGNALMAVATAPKKVIFSSDSKSFAALYDTPGLMTGIMNAYSFIRMYDTENGDILGSIGGFTKPIQDFDYSPDGKRLVVGFVDGSIILWDVQNAQATFGSRHMNAPLWEIEYSYDSQYLLIKRAEEVEVRLTTSGSLLYRFGAVDFAVSPANNLMALGDEEGNITIRDLGTGEGIRKIEAHDDRIYSLAFSSNGRYLASSGQDCNIKLWDVETGKLLHYFEETVVDPYEMEMTSRIFSTYLEFIPNTNMLIGFGSWGTVVNWNVDSGATNYTIQSNALDTYTVKPEFPEFFVTDTPNNIFYINNHSFNLTTGEKLGAYEEPANLPKGCSPIGPISKDGQLLFTVGYNRYDGAEICILNPITYDLISTISVVENEIDERSSSVGWLYLSPDGKQLLATVGSGIVYVYQIVE